MTAETSSAKCVGSRVDYLQIAFVVDFHPDTLTVLRHRVVAARELGGNVAELVVGKLAAELRVPRDGSAERWHFKNGEVRGQIGLREPGGWSLEFHVSALYLATHRIEDAVAMCEQIATSLGVVRGRRLRRLDLAADFVGFPLDQSMSGSFVKPRRGKLGAFVPEVADTEQPKQEMYMRGESVTGFTVCPGNDAMARIYDKTAELQLAGREEKREIEFSRWSVRGWTPDEQVTRVEFQLRGTALDELDLRDPTAKRLAERLDPVWQYLTRCWLRMVNDDATRKSRCSDSKTWQEVQAVKFVHAASPATRSRRRGGATHEQALGALLSSMHGMRWLPRMDEPSPELTKDQSDALLRSMLVDLHLTAAMRTADHFQSAHGIESAPHVLVTKWNATYRRFYCAGDHEIQGHWTATPSNDPAAPWLLSYVEPEELLRGAAE